MEKFRIWYTTYSTEITWFIIGWCIMASLNSLERGDHTGALINLVLAGLNYMLGRR